MRNTETHTQNDTHTHTLIQAELYIIRMMMAEIYQQSAYLGSSMEWGQDWLSEVAY